ncbi:hypothetical protein P7C73_g3563, partial [Tremellales sp. Uapishka_1]
MSSLSAPVPKLLVPNSPLPPTAEEPHFHTQQPAPAPSKPIHAVPTHLRTGPDARESFTPQNTPAEPLAIGRTPINAVHASAMRGKGIPLPGGGGIGRGPLTPTPGNTPSSMEKISKRIATNLLVGNSLGNAPLGNKIVPQSYERRFTAGLKDLNERVGQGQVNFDPNSVSPPRTFDQFSAGSASETKVDWPASFSLTTESRGSGEKRPWLGGKIKEDGMRATLTTAPVTAPPLVVLIGICPPVALDVCVAGWADTEVVDFTEADDIADDIDADVDIGIDVNVGTGTLVLFLDREEDIEGDWERVMVGTEVVVRVRVSVETVEVIVLVVVD